MNMMQLISLIKYCKYLDTPTRDVIFTLETKAAKFFAHLMTALSVYPLETPKTYLHRSKSYTGSVTHITMNRHVPSARGSHMSMREVQHVSS